MDIKLQEYILNRVNKDLVASGCWEWVKAKSQWGYGTTGNGKWYKKYSKQKIHQLSYIAFNGVYDKKLFVLHKCHNPKCCNPLHLRTGTNADNVQDRVSSKRYNRSNSKLTKEEVAIIKTLLGKIRQRDLAAMFGVKQQAISSINTGKNW